MRIHFMGAGGSGMSGLALMARMLGHTVSGCDRSRSPYVDMLVKQGIPVEIGHDPAHLDAADMLVHSSAIAADESEITVARDVCRIPVLTRGAFLAELLKGRDAVGIAGAHGKTTTTWLAWRILRRFGLPASLYAGGKSEGACAVAGAEPWVVELDESDGSVFLPRPQALVITNLELEHVDHYGDEAEMLRRFREHLARIGHRRFVIGRGYPISDRLYAEFGGLTFPTRDEILARTAVNGGPGCRFTCADGRWYLDFHGVRSDIASALEPPHVVQNRAAALLAAYTALRGRGLELEPIDALFWQGLPCVERRFERKGLWRDMALVDDYAHHPSELAALMDRAEVEFGRYLLVFQPHRHTRFDRFFNDFARVLRRAPGLIILPVYRSGESSGTKDPHELYRLLKKEEMPVVHYCSSLGEAATMISAGSFGWARAVVTAGAGDVNAIFDLLEGR